MMKKIQFSVLMSLYTKEQPEFLHQCLESIKAQSLQADEIVIVLDGPITDDLQRALNMWSNELPLNIYPQEKNQGLGKALNIGLSLCKNEIVFRMDTDDICIKNRFLRQIEYLNKNPDVDILSCNIEEFLLIPKDLKRLRKVPYRDGISKHIAFKNPINHMGVVYKKSKIISSGGYQHLESMEDYYLWLRCYKEGLILDNINETLIYARIGNGMLERRKGKNYIISEWKLHQHKIRLLPNENKIKLISILTLRLIPRLMPKTFLNSLYKLNRS